MAHLSRTFSRPRGRVLLLLLGVGGAFLAQHQANVASVPFWVLAATAIAITAGALITGRPFAIDQTWPRQRTAPGTASTHPSAMDIAAGTLGGSAAFAALLWSIGPYSYHGHIFSSDLSTWACAVWAGGLGIALLWLGIHGRQAAFGDPRGTSRIPVGRIELAVLVLILLAGAGLRLWHLGGLPEGVWSDEVDSAQDAIRLLHMPFQPFAPGNFGHNPSLYFYAIAGVFKVAGPSITAARVTSALFGMGGIGVVYLLGRFGGGPALGLIAAILIAVAPWSVTFSRVAMPDIPIPAVTGLGYFFLILALRDGKPFDFAASGVALGAAFLIYPGAYIPGVLAVVLLWWRCRSDPAFSLATRQIRLLLPLALVAAAAPTLIVLVRDTDFALARVRSLSLFSQYPDLHQRISAVMSNLRAYLLMFTVAGDQNGRHNLSGAPMLDPVTGACFLLGLGVCLRRWSSWYARIMLLWLAANLAGGMFSLTTEAPHAARTIGALAPLAVIAALPLAYLATFIRQALSLNNASSGDIRTAEGRTPLHRPRAGFPKTNPALAAFLVVAAPIAGASTLGIHRYFGEQVTSPTSWYAMDGMQTVMARAIPALLRRQLDVAIAPGISDDWIISTLAPQWTLRTFSPSAPVPLPLPGSGAALIVPASDPELLARLRARRDISSTITLTPGFDRTHAAAYVFIISR